MLTTLPTIKARLGLEAFAPDDDALLTNLLKHVTARFAAECNRVFDYAAGLTYEFRADQLNIVADHTFLRPPLLPATCAIARSPPHVGNRMNTVPGSCV